MKERLLAIFFAGCVIALWIFLLQQKEHIHEISALIEDAGSLSYFAYILLLIASAIFLPLSAMPIIPLAAAIFGPQTTVLLSIIGWTAGASIAFVLARQYGRRALEKYISLGKLDSIVETIPVKNRFLYILVFRLVLPTDLASYALGLTKSLGFKEYFLASLIAFSWYSLLLAYLGQAVLEGNHIIALKLGGMLLVIFSIGWYLLRHSKNS